MHRMGLFLLLIVVLAACGPTEISLEDVGKAEWTLVALNGGAPVTGAKVTLNFFEDNLNGTTGCNVYQAQYSISGESIDIFDMVLTKAYCEDPVGIMDQELAYIEIFGNASKILMEDGQLMLLTDDERFLLFDE